MKPIDWRGQRWWRGGVLVLTVLTVVLLASHPELRLLVPLVDSLGVDLLLVLMGTQFLDLARPCAIALYRRALRPLTLRIYALAIFLLGIAGPYVEGRLALAGIVRAGQDGAFAAA